MSALLDTFVPLSPFKMLKLIKYLKLIQKRNIGKIDRLQSRLFHDDLKVIVGGKGRISGLYRGWPEYRDKIILAEVNTPAEVLNISTSRNTVILVTRLHGVREGKTMDLQVVFIFSFHKGKIIEGRSIPVDDYVWDKFWE